MAKRERVKLTAAEAERAEKEAAGFRKLWQKAIASGDKKHHRDPKAAEERSALMVNTLEAEWYASVMKHQLVAARASDECDSCAVAQSRTVVRDVYGAHLSPANKEKLEAFFQTLPGDRGEPRIYEGGAAVAEVVAVTVIPDPPEVPKE